MKRSVQIHMKRFTRDTEGATIIELAIIVPILLLLVLGIFEFGRLGYHETVGHKATDLAARTAAVRPSACDGVGGQIVLPEVYNPPQNSAPRFGTLCRVPSNGGATCAPVATQSCNLQDALAVNNATAQEIWRTVAPLLPGAATPRNVEISYTFDDQLGFLGGPYTPIVTAEIVDLRFQFITPLGALAALAGADGNNQIANSIPFPSMSASLPAEDLGQGLGG